MFRDRAAEIDAWVTQFNEAVAEQERHRIG